MPAEKIPVISVIQRIKVNFYFKASILPHSYNGIEVIELNALLAGSFQLPLWKRKETQENQGFILLLRGSNQGSQYHAITQS